MLTVNDAEYFKKNYGEIRSAGDPGSHYYELTEEQIQVKMSLILTLLDDMFYLKKGIAANSFREKIDRRLKECCADEETISKLWELQEYIQKADDNLRERYL